MLMVFEAGQIVVEYPPLSLIETLIRQRLSQKVLTIPMG